MLYRVYGLLFKSEMVFPELPHALVEESEKTPADIEFRVDTPHLPERLEPVFKLEHETLQVYQGRPFRQVYRGDGVYVMRFADTGDFVMAASGQGVRCQPLPGAADEDIRACILGPVLAFCIQLRGRLVLHASGVVAGGRTAAFVNIAGGGKSTLAAVCVQIGYLLLTDDILALAEAAGGVWGCPGYPRLRLWPEALRHLRYTIDHYPRVVPNLEKRLVPVTGRFHASPAPLGVIYLLEASPQAADVDILIETVKPSQAVVALVGHTFGIGWITPEMQKEQFDGYCRIVNQIPVCKVAFPRDLSRLEGFARALLADFAGQVSPV